MNKVGWNLHVSAPYRAEIRPSWGGRSQSIAHGHKIILQENLHCQCKGRNRRINSVLWPDRRCGEMRNDDEDDDYMMMMITGRGSRGRGGAAEGENSLADVNECWLLNLIARKLKLAETSKERRRLGGKKKMENARNQRNSPE